jgi:carboxylesterase
VVEIHVPAYQLAGGPTGILLVHGFTASPTELRPLGEYLHQTGFSVLGLRLAGHGTSVEDLSHTTRHDWQQSVLAGYAELAQCCDSIVAIGLSMGGVLCCQLATQCPLAGLCLLAPSFHIRSPLLFLTPWLRGLLQPRKKSKATLAYYDQHQLFSYPSMPIPALAELYRLLSRVRPLLPRIEAPCRIYMGLRDHTVVPASALSIFNALGSERKGLGLLPASGHILSVEPDAPQLFASVLRFVQGLTNN